MQMTAVQSSQVAGVGYNPATQDLAIEFTSGGVYTYHGVPAEVHTDMMEAESIGRFVNQAIKPVYVSTRPDGSTCPPTVPKAPKASGNGKPAAAPPADGHSITINPTNVVTGEKVGPITEAGLPAPVIPAAKATNALPQADEPYTHEQLVADLQAANVLLAGFVPPTLSKPQDLEWLAGVLAACDEDLVRLEAEYDAAADEVIARRNALRRYFEPQARHITEQTVAVLGGARKSIDTPIPGRPGEVMRWSLTKQGGGIRLDDAAAAKVWAEEHLPDAITIVPAHMIPAQEVEEQRLLDAGKLFDAWKADPKTVPGGFVKVPVTQRFSWKPVATGKEG